MGVLWRLNDDQYNRFAVKNRGFSYLPGSRRTVAYKEKY